MKKKQITLSKKTREMRFNSLSEKVRKLLDSIDHQILIDKTEQWLLSLPKKQRIDLFERYFTNGFSLTELEDYAIFVALAEKLCRDHVNIYLYPFDEPMGVKRIPIDALKIEIDDCPDDWITLFEAIICRITKRHSVELPESIQQDAPDEAAEDIEIDSLTKEQQWRNDAPEYIPNARAVEMANDKISLPDLTKLLRKQGNVIRWMRNKQTRRSKVHIQDFLRHTKSVKSQNAKSQDDFSEVVFEQRARQAEIDRNKKSFR